MGCFKSKELVVMGKVLPQVVVGKIAGDVSRPSWTHFELWEKRLHDEDDFYYGRVKKTFPEIYYIKSGPVVTLKLYEYCKPSEAVVFITENKGDERKVKEYRDSRIFRKVLPELNKLHGVDFREVEDFICKFLDKVNGVQSVVVGEGDTLQRTLVM